MSEGEFSIVMSSMVIRSLVNIFVLFFLPSTTLGTISPVMAKYAIEESTRVGNTVGSIYATAAIGSIIGTFLSGFLLIPLLGIKTIIFIIGISIALLSLIVKGRRIVSVVLICGITLCYIFFYSETFNIELLKRKKIVGQKVFLKDTQYSYIEVIDITRGNKVERILRMDGLIHNRYDPDDPNNLIYDYEKIFSAFTEHFTNGMKENVRLTTLTLGGGACVFPAYIERHYQESINEIVEIDPEVIEVAHKFFDFPRDSTIQIYTCDARSYVYSIRERKKYDLIFLDAFNSFSVPSHLTTREFTELIRDLLNNPGYFIVNCVDIFSVGKILNAYLNKLAAVFPYYSVYSTSGFASSGRDTFVIITGNKEIGLDSLQETNSQITFYRVESYLLMDLVARNGKTILTDDYAPVENLIAPVFLHSVK